MNTPRPTPRLFCFRCVRVPVTLCSLKTVRHFTWVGATALVVISSALWLWAASVTRRWIFAENGAMENFQVGCLCLGAAVLAWQARSVKQAHQRVFFTALALFFVTFALREFDVRKGDWPPLVTRVLDGVIRNLWLGSLWLVIGYFAYRHRAGLLSFGLKWLGSRAGRVLLVAGLFWVLAAAVDKADAFGTRRRNLLAEELIEVNAALLMAFSAVISMIPSRNMLPGHTASQWSAAEAHDHPT